MRSRVIPGSSVTIDRRVPVSRLKIVDLPTLGRPTITTEGSFSAIIFCREDTTNPKREARNHLVYPTSRGNRSVRPLPDRAIINLGSGEGIQSRQTSPHNRE